ncbi:MAG: YbaB/EbfC family nucleoid-associated protein [Acidimicrobiales bacterium]
MSALLEKAQNLQQQLMEAQQAAASQTVEGHAGGGVVKIEATGGLEFRNVIIDPSVIDPADVEMLQDLVLAAIRDTVAKANELNQQAMGPMGNMMGGLGGALGGPTGG